MSVVMRWRRGEMKGVTNFHARMRHVRYEHVYLSRLLVEKSRTGFSTVLFWLLPPQFSCFPHRIYAALQIGIYAFLSGEREKKSTAPRRSFGVCVCVCLYCQTETDAKSKTRLLLGEISPIYQRSQPETH